MPYNKKFYASPASSFARRPSGGSDFSVSENSLVKVYAFCPHFSGGILFFLLSVSFLLLLLWGVSLFQFWKKTLPLFFLILRTVIYGSFLLLFWYPRFESVSKKLVEPKIAFLEDDSPSVKFLSSASQQPKEFLKDLEKRGPVEVFRFSENPYEKSPSVCKQVESFQKQGYRTLFLYTDAMETGFCKEAGIPVFILQAQPKTREFVTVHAKPFDLQFHLHQSVALEISLFLSASQKIFGDLILFLNSQKVSQQSLSLEPGENTTSLALNLQDPGLNHAKIQFIPQVQNHSNVSGAVNEVTVVPFEFSFYVHEKPLQVAVFAKKPSTDLSFYLRSMQKGHGLQASVCYSQIMKYSQNCLQTSPDLLFFYDSDFAFINEMQSRYSNLPRWIVLPGDQRKAEFSQNRSGEFPANFSKPSYFLDPSFAPFQIFSHQALRDAALDAIPVLSPKELSLTAKKDSETIFGIQDGTNLFPIMELDFLSRQKTVWVHTRSLYKIRFHPLFDKDNDRLFQAFVFDLIRYTGSKSRLDGLEVFLSAGWIYHGEELKFLIKSLQPLPVFLHNGKEKLLGTSTPFEKVFFPYPGDYRIEVLSEKPQQYPFLVVPHKSEFSSVSEIDKTIAMLTSAGGKLLLKEDSLSSLPGSLFEKRIEMEKISVDLQENSWFLVFLALLFVIEWILRWRWRMI